MGRQIELIHLDPQGDNARYQEFARRLLNRDKVDVLIGGITSASREAVRPIVNRTTTPYFYTNQYEGGVCDASMISMGAVPEQQFSTLIPWMVEKFGKKVYVIAADYNFGQISAEWNRKIMKDLGGKVVGEEFIPLGVSQFAQTIQNIQKAKPDWLLTINVGAAQDSFFEQAAAAKLNLPMGIVDQGHARLRAQALQAAGAQQHARDRELVRGDRHAGSRTPSRSAGRPSSPTRCTSTTWATTPTTRSTCTRRWSRRRSRPSSRTCAR